MRFDTVICASYCTYYLMLYCFVFAGKILHLHLKACSNINTSQFEKCSYKVYSYGARGVLLLRQHFNVIACSLHDLTAVTDTQHELDTRDKRKMS